MRLFLIHVLSKNLGYGAAIRSIFLKARELGIDALVTFDADGQHRIEDIESMLKPIKENKADIVIGSRFMQNNSKVPKYRKIGIKTITGLTNVATGLNVSDAQSGFRSYNKKSLENINPSDFGMGISTEILIKAKKMKLKIQNPLFRLTPKKPTKQNLLCCLKKNFQKMMTI